MGHNSHTTDAKSTPAQARGLNNFISDLCNTKSTLDESNRVEVELAKIRTKFNAASSQELSTYQRKKYVLKLVFIHLLGYEVNFGHAQVLVLVRSNNYNEKVVGYFALSLLLRGSDPIVSTLIDTIKKDLVTHYNSSKKGKSGLQNDAVQCMALCTLANMPGVELLQAVHLQVLQILISKDSTEQVKKKSALCLLRLSRARPDSISGTEFVHNIGQLLQEKHLGLLTSVMSLLNGLAFQQSMKYQVLLPQVVDILSMLVIEKKCEKEYLYYQTPNPWLQVKLIKFLKLYPNAVECHDFGLVTSENEHINQLINITSKILTQPSVSDSVYKSNSENAVLFETVDLIVAWGTTCPFSLREDAIQQMGRFISDPEPNIRYLGFSKMAKLAQIKGSVELCKKYQDHVLDFLNKDDKSVKKIALDLLYRICDAENAKVIVNELLAHLEVVDASIREEMLLKITLLAEKDATDLSWYIDTIYWLISIHGDYVSDHLWHQVVQTVRNNAQGDLRGYVAAKFFGGVSSKSCHEVTVRIAACILGDFGCLIAEMPGMSGSDQFRALHQHWPTVKPLTRAILVSNYTKLANMYEECRHLVLPIIANYKSSFDDEMQQHSEEYESLRESFSSKILEDLLHEILSFDDKRQSSLELQLLETEKENNMILPELSEVEQQYDFQSNYMHFHQSTEKSITNDEALFEEQFVPSRYSNKSVDNAYIDTDDYLEAEHKKLDMNCGSDHISPKEQSHNPMVVGIPKSSIPDIRKAFAYLCASKSGVLFTNSLIKVDVKHEYAGGQGSLSIRFENLHSTSLRNFNVTVDQPNHFRIQMQGTAGIIDNGDFNSSGCNLATRSLARLVILVEVTAPFDNAPSMRISFVTESGKHHVYPLHLPLVTTCFLEPVTLDQVAFMKKWKSLQSKGHESQEVMKMLPSVPELDAKYMDRVSKIIVAFNFSHCKSVDTSPWTVSGAAIFQTVATDKKGKRISVECLIRVEVNPKVKAFRVKTRAVHPLCSKAISNISRISIALAT